MKTILFQGDSITDARRDREDDIFFGTGYPTLVKGELGFEYPNQYTFYNRGVSGDRVVDLYARIKLHMINLKPDVISILVGVNDAYHEVTHQNGVSAEKYFQVYCLMIEELKEALPNVTIMIMEPFILEGAATRNAEDCPNRWNVLDSEVRKRAKKAREVAEKYGLPFVPLQEKFDETTKLASNEYWLYDGVHPTTAGHELIKREWLKCFYALKL